MVCIILNSVFFEKISSLSSLDSELIVVSGKVCTNA